MIRAGRCPGAIFEVIAILVPAVARVPRQLAPARRRRTLIGVERKTGQGERGADYRDVLAVERRHDDYN